MNGYERMALEKQAEIDRLQRRVARLEEILTKTALRVTGVLSFIQLVFGDVVEKEIIDAK